MPERDKFELPSGDPLGHFLPEQAPTLEARDGAWFTHALIWKNFRFCQQELTELTPHDVREIFEGYRQRLGQGFSPGTDNFTLLNVLAEGTRMEIHHQESENFGDSYQSLCQVNDLIEQAIELDSEPGLTPPGLTPPVRR